MEIIKVFSDLSGEERLYSVHLSEEEVAMFSSLVNPKTGKMVKGAKKLDRKLKKDLEVSLGKPLTGGHGRFNIRADYADQAILGGKYNGGSVNTTNNPVSAYRTSINPDRPRYSSWNREVELGESGKTKLHKRINDRSRIDREVEEIYGDARGRKMIDGIDNKYYMNTRARSLVSEKPRSRF